jgi:hypothetical protein
MKCCSNPSEILQPLAAKPQKKSKKAETATETAIVTARALQPTTTAAAPAAPTELSVAGDSAVAQNDTAHGGKGSTTSVDNTDVVVEFATRVWCMIVDTLSLLCDEQHAKEVVALLRTDNSGDNGDGDRDHLCGQQEQEGKSAGLDPVATHPLRRPGTPRLNASHYTNTVEQFNSLIAPDQATGKYSYQFIIEDL